MASWAELERAAPEIAASGRRLLDREVAFLASVARDGRPRIAPVSPIFSGENLCLSIGGHTPKRMDLLRDGRYALHARLGESDEEFQVSGRACLVGSESERARVHDAIYFEFDAADPIFALAIERCFWSLWENAGTSSMNQIRKAWSQT